MAPLEAAIATGLPCFPCSRNKTPTIPGPGGHKHATADAAALRALWRQYPGALVGVPTGEISGLAVLDVDLAKHREAACWLAANRGRLPRSRSHRTRSGALHFVFQHAHGVRNSQGRLASVDTRGEGGYVIWRPTAGCPAVCGAPPAPATLAARSVMAADASIKRGDRDRTGDARPASARGPAPQARLRARGATHRRPLLGCVPAR